MTPRCRLSSCLRAISRTLALVLLLSTGAFAEEPYREFLQGLRDHGYYDTAQEYLDEISARADLPAEIRAVLPFERAVMLIGSAKNVTSSKARRDQLNAAQASLEQFLADSPRHELAGDANTELGRILKEKALVDIWDADDPANSETRETFLSSARDYLLRAAEIFSQAETQHGEALKQFPVTIPDENKVLKAARADVENRYYWAKLYVVECVYWRAHTYDESSKEREDLLTQAQDAYAQIHSEFRLQRIGLVARLWQGKCFEEMGLLREAVGIYNEILGHPGMDNSLVELKSRALRFRLICLNHEDRRDHELVIKEATEWRNNAGPRNRTELGRGILFEMARAQEALADNRATSETDRANYLRLALANGREIARFPGELKSPALALVRRVAAKLNRPEQDPEDFDGAFGVASQFLSDVSELRTQIETAQAAGDAEKVAQLQEAFRATSSEATRLLDLALRLAKPDTDPLQLAQARLKLALSYFNEEKFYESAASAEYAAATLPAEFDDLARTAAFIQVAAFNNAYVREDPEQREFEKKQTIEAAELIITRWPDSDQATDARDTIANTYWNSGDKATAGEWWAKVPSTASDYAEYRIRAAGAYWSAYLENIALPKTEREPAETLNNWRGFADQYFQEGIAVREAQLPQESETPSELVLAKLNLAHLRNGIGTHTTKDGVLGAIELLSDGPHSVLDAVAVPPGEERPSDPADIRSAKVAGFAYQQLLRAYIGIRNLEAAADARAKLEAIAADDDSASLTQVYVSFGKELQRELDQLRASGETARLESVRSGFEEFLDSISQREQGQTFGSLLWIAETYTSLGEGSSDDRSKADAFFAKAANTYDDMLRRAESDSSFLSNPGQVAVIKLQLSDCRRRQGDFAAAEEAMLDAVAANPNAPNVQFAAAQLYHEWAKSSSLEADRFAVAINGRETEPAIWGWGGLASRLQRSLQTADPDPQLEQMHFDARFQLADACYQYASAQTDPAVHADYLSRARFGIEAFVRITADFPPAEMKRFDELYQSVLTEMGGDVVSLSQAVASVPTAGARTNQTTTSATGTSQTGADPGDDSRVSTNVPLIIGVVLVGIGAVVGLYFLAVGQDRKRHRRAVATAEKTGKQRR